jgi:hypothetical protein
MHLLVQNFQGDNMLLRKLFSTANLWIFRECGGQFLYILKSSQPIYVITLLFPYLNRVRPRAKYTDCTDEVLPLPRRKEFNVVKSSDLGGQAIGVLLPIHPRGIVWLRRLLTLGQIQRSTPAESSHNGSCDYSNSQNAPQHRRVEHRLDVCRATKGAHTELY